MVIAHFLILLAVLCVTAGAIYAQDQAGGGLPDSIQLALDNTTVLSHPRGDRLPLLVWPVLAGGEVDDEALQERIVRQLDSRGLATMATWNYDDKETSLARSLRIARIQQKLGLPIMVNANPSMHRFFNGDLKTAHVDADGKGFFDASFGEQHTMGCAFAVDFRYPDMTERIDYFVRAYKQAGLGLDLVWGDWEIDGPHEYNRSWEAAKRCVTCRRNIPDIESFDPYQKAMRLKRAEMTRRCYTEPILSRYPAALVGNYAVYPHDGYRYWWDYFESFVDYHPHRVDQGARYRKWFHEFDLTGYTFAMPTVYTWHDTFLWYDFDDPDYRWFYNMLLVASNAGRHTDPRVPIIAFVHWNTIVIPGPADPTVKQMSEHAYTELLWHMLLRGTDALFMWCGAAESAKETRLVHAVYADSLAYADWLNRGAPVNFDVPNRPGPVVSGLRIDDKVLVRRTDFGKPTDKPLTLQIDGRTLTVPPAPGRCVVLDLP